jgi:quercetin dioxygenase-like cupin family protein
VLADGEPTNAFELNGTRIVRLWETPAVPASLPLQSDAGATAGNAYREGFRGTSFYVAELPGGARAPSIPMHRNTTLDYMAILSGRIVFKIDDREIELAAGDTLVQGGNLHSWINRWDEPCLLLFVVVTATATTTDANPAA